MKNLIVRFTGLAALVLFFTMSAFTTDHTSDPETEQPKAIDLTFVDHLKAGMIEQDVYVEKVAGSGEVYRVMPDEREQYMDAEVFATAEAQSHDPFFKRNAGPYKKGESLGITLGEWLQGQGKAAYYCEDGWGVFTASFTGLMPNATYTMWHAFMAKPPTDPFPGTIDLPLGDRNGSQSVFTTDEKGNATMKVRFETCLQLTDKQLMSVLAIAYHSDSKTYGFSPGPFGKATHVQLFAVLPDIDDIEG